MIKRILLVLGTVVLLVWLAFSYLSSGNLNAKEKESMITYGDAPAISDSTLRVMTYNLGYLSGMTNNRSIKRETAFFADHLQQAGELLAGAEADVVGFQEIDFGASRSFHVNQLDTLALAGNYTSAYRSVNWDKKYVPFPYWPPSNHFGEMLSGQAILSKLPMEAIETVTLAAPENAPSYYKAFYLDRLLQIAEVDFLGTSVIMMNVHLEAFYTETRLEQIQTIMEVYESYAEQQPVILIGDFNSEIAAIADEPDAIEMLMKSKGIASAVPFQQEASHRTFSSKQPEKMIDYLFYNEAFLSCTEARVATEAGQISDHLPVLASFRLK